MFRFPIQKLFIVTATSLVCLISTSGCANKSSSTSGSTTSAPQGPAILIGEYGSMTGATATFGKSTDNGIQLAAEQMNADGGINGVPVSIILKDDESKAEQALTVVKLLIEQEHVTAILGEVASTRSINAAPECQSQHVPMISPSSTNPKVTTLGDYIFRVCFIDPFQGYAAAKFAIQSIKAKNAAIFTDSTNDYSVGLSDVFKTQFSKLGGNIVIAQNYGKDDPDFKAQLIAIKSKNPDVLYVPGYYNNVGTIARQAREVGITCPLLGGDGWDSPELIKSAGGPGKALEGCYFTNHYSPTDPNPLTQRFVADYKAKYGETPDSLAAMGYDAFGVLANALKTIGKPADGNFDSDSYRAKLRDAIAATNGFAGVTGKITLDKNRNAVKPAVVLQVKGNTFTYVTSIAP